ncbi:hypothetical protein Trydic_g6693 [Trypoxylus dichotomus]
MTHSFHILLIVVSLLQIKWSISSLHGGSSVKLKRETTNNDGCLLPEHPQYGHYKLPSGRAYKVNATAAISTILVITCDQGYTPGRTLFFFCSNGRWVPELSHCVSTCPSVPQSDTYDAVCHLDGREVSCENPMQNTTVRRYCKRYYNSLIAWAIPKCKDGNWDQRFWPCYPECGRKIVNGDTLGKNGTDAEQGEYPWVVGIYNTSSSNKQPLCGGSIISRAFVLSAAHCFVSVTGIVHDKNWYTLVAGKYHSSLDISEQGAQARKIKTIYVHEDYRGHLTKYRDDIALIEVEEFEITQLVQLVCIDWENIYEKNDFKEDNKAVIAGWGFTTGGTTPPEVLKKIIVPFRSSDTCSQFKNKDFFRYYHSTDKICAGYEDQGYTICTGNSGGGLVFQSLPRKYFVQGLLSLTPRSLEGCNATRYGLFTKVSRYISWLEAITKRRL